MADSLFFIGLQSSKRNSLAIRNFVNIRAQMAMVLSPKPRATVSTSAIRRECGTMTWDGIAAVELE